MVSFQARNQTWHFQNFQTGERATVNTLRNADTNGDQKVTDAEREAAGLVISNGEGGIVGFEHVGLEHIDFSPESRNENSGIPGIGWEAFGFEDVGDYKFVNGRESDILELIHTGPDIIGEVLPEDPFS